MKVEQIYTGCLAQGAYYIQSGNEACIIDPLREVRPYLERAKADGVEIKYVFETHFHADFVSGHVTLSKKTGAPIVYGPNADPSFDAHIAYDGEEFAMGDVKLRAIHTPGHTMESTCYLLIDKDGNEHSLFTGDTLFIGDVGRPDLAQKMGELTIDDLAGYLYESLRDKVMTLPDDLNIYPAHGAGSACGKNMMKETTDTLGNQKKINYALRSDMTKQEFVHEVTEGLLPPPAYFPANVNLNKKGYENLEHIIDKGAKGLSPQQFEDAVSHYGALVLDTRTPDEFEKGHIPNSIFIGLDGSFAPWVGELIIDVEQPLLLVVQHGREEEAVTRLARVGFDNTLGYLKEGIEAWVSNGKDVDTVASIDASEFTENADMQIMDVRRESEYENGHLINAYCAPLRNLNNYSAAISPEQECYIHCAGGYRSMIASSILKSRGIHNIINIRGGYTALLAAGASVDETTLNSA